MVNENSKLGSRSDQLVDLEELGKDINLSFDQEQLRSLVCPACERKYIRNYRKDLKFILCVCGVRIRLIERWYDA
jgi:hypothetical protein